MNRALWSDSIRDEIFCLVLALKKKKLFLCFSLMFVIIFHTLGYSEIDQKESNKKYERFRVKAKRVMKSISSLG